LDQGEFDINSNPSILDRNKDTLALEKESQKKKHLAKKERKKWIRKKTKKERATFEIIHSCRKKNITVGFFLFYLRQMISECKKIYNEHTVFFAKIMKNLCKVAYLFFLFCKLGSCSLYG
jgi:hypothetical protein